MSLPEITEKQQQALRFIRRYIEEHTRSPTMEEIGKDMGVSAVTGWQHVNALVKKGLIFIRENKARSIEVRDPRFRPDMTLRTKVKRKVGSDKEFAQFILELADEIGKDGDVQASTGN